jgi:PAS domain S-box-containing protein
MPRKQSLSQSMNRIGKLIHSTLDLREILERVMPEAARAVGSETAAVSLRQGDHWVVRYVHGFPQDMIGAQMDGRREPHVVLAIQTKKPVVINDAFTDARVNCPHMKKWGVHAVLVVPLVMEDEVIGVLSFNRHKPGVPFRKSHADFAGQLASSLSLAVGNAHLFAELQAELAQRGKAERAQQEANEQLQRQSEELRAANEELQAQAEELRAANEELQAQQEELRTQTEELCEGAQALRESEERHRSLFENMLDGYAFCQMLFDRQRRPLDFVYLSVNDAFTRLTGLKDVVGRKVTEVIPTVRTSHPELLETYGRVATTGRPERFEIEFQPLGMWFSISVYCPRPGYFTAVFDNITARKRAEEALRRSEERFHTMANAIPPLAWIARADGYIYWYNQRWYDYTGATPEQMEGWRWQSVHDPRELPKVLERWKSSLATGQPFDMIFPLRGADGIFRPFLTRVMPLRDEQGRVQQWFGTNTDISEQKRVEAALQQANEQLQAQAEELQTQAEELRTQTNELADVNAALRESEERFRRYFELGLIGMAITSPTKGWIEVNDECCRLLGYERDELVQKTWAELTHPDDLAADVTQFDRVLTGQIDGYQIDKRFIRKNGQVVDVTLSVTGMRGADGAVDYFLALLQDITARKRSEKALREWNVTLESKVAQRTAELEHRARQLQKLTLELSQVEDRERQRLAEILHDDLQQIIAGAKFHLTVLRNRVKHDASLQAIGSHIDEMLREAVEKSRTLSHELSPAVLHYGDLTEALDWLAGQINAKHGLVVHVRADGPADLQSETVGSFLYKAAQELLFNGVKHARVQEAQLRVRRHGSYICVSVSDRGRGFDPQGVRLTAGFGLLSIRERIELLGGRMKIRSAPGRGSTFFLVVPNRETPEDSVGAGPRAYPTSEAKPDDHGLGGHRGPPLRVLLADDHRIVREGLRSLLGEQNDIEIVGEAVHGREAVDLALRLKPEVVIMDVAMPLIDGDEATRQIKAHRPQTRVIALSTYNETEMLQRMYRAGAEGYVLKTASAEELLAAIRGHNTGGS